MAPSHPLDGDRSGVVMAFDAAVGIDPGALRRLARELADAATGLRAAHADIVRTAGTAGVGDPTGGRALRAALRCDEAAADVRRRCAVVERRLDVWSQAGLELVLWAAGRGAGVPAVDLAAMREAGLPAGVVSGGRTLGRARLVTRSADELATEARRLRVLARTGDVAAAARVTDGWSRVLDGIDDLGATAARAGGVAGELAVPIGGVVRAGRTVSRVLPVVDAAMDVGVLVDPPHDGAYGVADRVVAGSSLLAGGISAAATVGLVTLTPVGATVVSIVVVGGAVYTLGSMAWDAWGDDLTRAARAGWERVGDAGRAVLDGAVDATGTVIDAGRTIGEGVVTAIDVGVAWTGERVDELADVTGDVLDAVSFWD